jgi:AraC-like DNA-binding protein
MSAIERFSTSQVVAAERLDFWNRLTSETYPGTTIDQRAPLFEAEMLRWRLGDLTMIRPRALASAVSRVPASSETGRVVLHLHHSGRGLHEQHGHSAELDVGDFALCDADAAYRIDVAAHECLVVEMPRAALAARLPDLETWFARRVPGASPGGRLLHNFLLSLWQQGDQSDADPVWQDGVANVLLDLMALAVRGSAAQSPAPLPLREQMLRVIDAHLSDAGFGTTQLAQVLRVSVRTVQNVFAGMGTTPSGYILSRRLARASELLIINPQMSVTEIAFELGFSESGYFARRFRQQFNASPREWRARR